MVIRNEFIKYLWLKSVTIKNVLYFQIVFIVTTYKLLSITILSDYCYQVTITSIH